MTNAELAQAIIAQALAAVPRGALPLIFGGGAEPLPEEALILTAEQTVRDDFGALETTLNLSLMAAAEPRTHALAAALEQTLALLTPAALDTHAEHFALPAGTVHAFAYDGQTAVYDDTGSALITFTMRLTLPPALEA
mgnify:FL=1